MYRLFSFQVVFFCCFPLLFSFFPLLCICLKKQEESALLFIRFNDNIHQSKSDNSCFKTAVSKQL